MTINDQNMEKISELDFVKLNEILSNEQFANWYYSQFTSDTDVNIGIMEFIEIIKNYSDKSDDQIIILIKKNYLPISIYK